MPCKKSLEECDDAEKTNKRNGKKGGKRSPAQDVMQEVPKKRVLNVMMEKRQEDK